MGPAAGDLEAIVGVYDADGSLLGELSYVAKKAAGRAHCALCDITHGRLRRKPAFDAAIAQLPVPFELLHRDEQPPALAQTTTGHLPCVALRRGERYEVLLGPAELESCNGEPMALVDAVRAALGC